MPIYRLPEEHVFPRPEEAEFDGLLAVGGDLHPHRLVAAYAQGIFPWYGPGSPILWWSTDPRLVLIPHRLHLPRRLERTLRAGKFSFTMDRDFASVIRACAAAPRPGQDGTWLGPDMIAAYERLHELGLAHSLEAWTAGGPDRGELAGGLYGLSLGRVFFGESMFHRVADASKACLAVLARQLGAWGFELIDCQQTTPHMVRLGAAEINRAEFLRRLELGLRTPTRQGTWELEPGHENGPNHGQEGP